MKRLIFYLVPLIVALGLLLSLRVDDHNEGSLDSGSSAARSAPPEEPQNPTPVELAPEAPVEPPLEGPPLELDPQLAKQLASLRQTYLDEKVSPARIRIQGALDRLWANNPPPEILIHEIRDEEAPLAYRLHFAQRVRNLAKASGLETRDLLSQSLRKVIESPENRMETRVALAGSLMEFDESETSIRAVASLVEQSGDDALAAQAIASLSLSKQDTARDFLWDWTRRQLPEIDRQPRALATALAPLARESDLPIDPLLAEVISRSTHFQLFSTALQCAIIRPPSRDSVQTMATAYLRANTFAPEEMAQIELLCRRSLQRLGPFLRQNQSRFSPTLQSQLDHILKAKP